MRSYVLPMLVLVFSLVACGGTADTALCNDLQAAFDGFATKSAPCGVQFTSPITPSTCASHLPNCTDADRTVLSNFARCMNGVPTCSQSTAQDWGNQVQGCLSGLNQVSKACSGQ